MCGLWVNDAPPLGQAVPAASRLRLWPSNPIAHAPRDLVDFLAPTLIEVHPGTGPAPR